jgi:hypothetical protein
MTRRPPPLARHKLRPIQKLAFDVLGGMQTSYSLCIGQSTLDCGQSFVRRFLIDRWDTGLTLAQSLLGEHPTDSMSPAPRDHAGIGGNPAIAQ